MGDNELSQADIDALFAGVNTTNEGTESAQKPEPEPGKELPQKQKSEQKPKESHKPEAVAQPVEFAQLTKRDLATSTNSKIDFLLDVPVLVTVELGRTDMFIKEVLNLGVGSVVELNKLAGEPVDLLINNKLVARGEVVVINENFGVKIIDIISPEQRIKHLN